MEEEGEGREKGETHKCKHTRTRTRVGQTGGEKDEGVGKEDTGEGFITRDLLLLPGGGGSLRRRCIRGVCLSDTCSSCVYIHVYET